MKDPTRQPRSSPREMENAFSLVEVVIAVGIVAFGLIAIFGLLPAGLFSVREGKAQEEATDLLTFAATELRMAEASGSPSPLLELNPMAQTNQISTFNSLGEPVLPESPDALYRLSIIPLTNSAFPGRAFRLEVAWPALAETPTGTAESIVALPERQTGTAP